MSHPALNAVITATVSALNPRAGYAADVVVGRQRWSGADLRGKASRYGARYAAQRANARNALHRAGGVIVAGPRGLLSTAVCVGVDDFGVELYATVEFGLVPATDLR